IDPCSGIAEVSGSGIHLVWSGTDGSGIHTVLAEGVNGGELLLDILDTQGRTIIADQRYMTGGNEVARLTFDLSHVAAAPLVVVIHANGALAALPIMHTTR
ncbi:MAG: hypothetical protein KA230_05540, partial [Flavobacteriales bacterium]|nr:hypothetical protein [Flavobacteriales bacterium]